eukprot:TRINITY_DN921_c0_g1_i4.p1 TRINITY_DN921_c0_g1~~TRINITY_DN921_c0_g1_i4.p1  ORF type:complete len:916 (+),score=222.58 TRINITY_DN921_c0_g1_i4:122-2749(+)
MAPPPEAPEHRRQPHDAYCSTVRSGFSQLALSAVCIAALSIAAVTFAGTSALLLRLVLAACRDSAGQLALAGSTWLVGFVAMHIPLQHLDLPAATAAQRNLFFAMVGVTAIALGRIVDGGSLETQMFLAGVVLRVECEHTAAQRPQRRLLRRAPGRMRRPPQGSASGSCTSPRSPRRAFPCRPGWAQSPRVAHASQRAEPGAQPLSPRSSPAPPSSPTRAGRRRSPVGHRRSGVAGAGSAAKGRGQLRRRASAARPLQEGAMAAVALTPKEARDTQARLGLQVEVAAVNQRDSITISGKADAIDGFGKWATQKKVYLVKLGVRRAAEYFWGNIRNTVNFFGGLEVLQDKCDLVVEVSPHSVLRQCVQSIPSTPYVHTLRRGKDDSREFVKSVSTALCMGVNVDWSGLREPARYDVDLPPMPWNSQPLRMGYFANPELRPGAGGAFVAAGTGLSMAPAAAGFNVVLDGASWGYVFDHIIKGAIVVPGAMLMSIALELPTPVPGMSVVDMEFRRMLTWPDGDDALQFMTYFDGRAFAMEREGVMRNKGSRALRPVPPPIELGGLAAAEARCTTVVDVASAYRVWSKHANFELGPAWRVVEAVSLGDGEAVSTLKVPCDSLCTFHPTILDGTFQSLIFLVGLTPDAYVPVHLSQLTMLVDKMPIERVRVHGRLVKAQPGSVTVDIDVYSEGGERLAAIRGVTGGRPSESPNGGVRLLTVARQPRALSAAATSAAVDDSARPEAVAEALAQGQWSQNVRRLRLAGALSIVAAEQHIRRRELDEECCRNRKNLRRSYIRFFSALKIASALGVLGLAAAAAAAQAAAAAAAHMHVAQPRGLQRSAASADDLLHHQCAQAADTGTRRAATPHPRARPDWCTR